MLKLIKAFLKPLIIYGTYLGGFVVAFLTIFQRVEWGLYMFVFLIPIPSFWHKFIKLPLGKDFMDLFFAAVLLGICIQGKGFAKTRNATLIFIFLLVSYISLWKTWLGFNIPMPLTKSCAPFVDWKNYAEMIGLYYLALNAIHTEKEIKIVTAIMAAATFLISFRNLRNFSAGASFNWNKRASGPFEAVGLGPNHFGAYIVDYCAAFLGMSFFVGDVWLKWLFLGTVLLGIHPLFFSYSRGAYVAALGVTGLYGLRKKSLLFLVVLLLITWQTVLPASVVDRISMTQTQSGQLDGSSAERIVLWEHATKLFEEHPIFGLGFEGFYLSMAGDKLTDTHDFYVKTLADQGIIGIILLLMLLWSAFKSGWKLYRFANTPFLKGLGFGFIGCLISMLITNLFGDRWSYFQLGGYFWVLWGLTDRAILISSAPEEAKVGTFAPTPSTTAV